MSLDIVKLGCDSFLYILVSAKNLKRVSWGFLQNWRTFLRPNAVLSRHGPILFADTGSERDLHRPCDAEPYRDQSVIFHQDGKLTLDLEGLDAHRRAQRS